MLNKILRLFLNEFGKTVYDAAVNTGFTTSTFYNRNYPDFHINVNGVKVKVEFGCIEVAHQRLPRSNVLYTLMKRLNKKKQADIKKRQAMEAYQEALKAVKGNQEK